MLHEDDVACIAQIKRGFIKVDKTKHIFLKFFYAHDFKMTMKLMFNRSNKSIHKSVTIDYIKKVKMQH